MTKLEKNDADKLVSYVKEKWSNQSCPMCRAGNWLVQDKYFQLTQYKANALMVGGPVIPIIPITCSNCSNTLLLNAIHAGIIQTKEVETQKQENNTPSGIKDKNG